MRSEDQVAQFLDLLRVDQNNGFFEDPQCVLKYKPPDLIGRTVEISDPSIKLILGEDPEHYKVVNYAVKGVVDVIGSGAKIDDFNALFECPVTFECFSSTEEGMGANILGCGHTFSVKTVKDLGQCPSCQKSINTELTAVNHLMNALGDLYIKLTDADKQALLDHPAALLDPAAMVAPLLQKRESMQAVLEQLRSWGYHGAKKLQIDNALQQDAPITLLHWVVSLASNEGFEKDLKYIIASLRVLIELNAFPIHSNDCFITLPVWKGALSNLLSILMKEQQYDLLLLMFNQFRNPADVFGLFKDACTLLGQDAPSLIQAFMDHASWSVLLRFMCECLTAAPESATDSHASVFQKYFKDAIINKVASSCRESLNDSDVINDDFIGILKWILLGLLEEPIQQQEKDPLLWLCSLRLPSAYKKRMLETILPDLARLVDLRSAEKIYAIISALRDGANTTDVDINMFVNEAIKMPAEQCGNFLVSVLLERFDEKTANNLSVAFDKIKKNQALAADYKRSCLMALRAAAYKELVTPIVSSPEGGKKGGASPMNVLIGLKKNSIFSGHREDYFWNRWGWVDTATVKRINREINKIRATPVSFGPGKSG